MPKDPNNLGMTDKQREVYDLRHSTDPLMSFYEVARRLGISYESAKKRYSSTPIAPTRPGYHPTLEETDPEKAAHLMQRLIDREHSDGWLTIKQVAIDCGVPERTAQRFLSRMEKDYLPMKLVAEKVQTEGLRDLFGTVARKILESIHPDDIKKAGLKDKLIAAGIATDKLNVLSDRPTQIIRTEQYNVDLVAAAKVLTQEIERRGMTIDIDPIDQTVTTTKVVGQDGSS